MRAWMVIPFLLLFAASCVNPFIEYAMGIKTVSFNSNGGSAVSEQKLFWGDAVSRPGDPFKENCVFDDWYEDNDTFEIKYKFDTEPENSLTVHAKWRIFDVVFSPDSIDFGTVYMIYDDIEPQIITLTNTGDLPAGLLSISLSGSNPGSFLIVPDYFMELETGESAAFSVAPRQGLSIGVHTAVISVSAGSNTFANINVSFTVIKAPVSGIVVIQQPYKLEYVHGEALNLNGLIVKVVYLDSSEEEIEFENFAANGISISMKNGMRLVRSSHNGNSVTVSIEGFNDATDVLFIDKAPGANISGFAVSGNPNTLTVTVTNVETASSTGQGFQYSCDTVNAIPSSWSDSSEFVVLSDTIYYVFARSAENENYYAGTPGDLRETAFFTVTFYRNHDIADTEMMQVIVLAGNAVNPPVPPSRNDGYDFTGWFLNDGAVLWNFASGITSTLDLYAGWKEHDTTAIIVLNVNEIQDIGAVIDGTPSINYATILSRSGAGFPANVQITLSAPAAYESVLWTIDCVGIYANDPPVTGNGASFTIDAAEIRYNSLGGHVLRLDIVINGTLYRRNILFTIAE